MARAASLRAVMATSQPSRASSKAIAAPMPLLAPVTRATLPLSPSSIVQRYLEGPEVFEHQTEGVKRYKNEGPQHAIGAAIEQDCVFNPVAVTIAPVMPLDQLEQFHDVWASKYLPLLGSAPKTSKSLLTVEMSIHAPGKGGAIVTCAREYSCR